ncbi:MAG: ABC transporter ATP-binding protein, partial [Armatimonadetes bacterium]|nr:ABC transporter ATP-binding protein [Armatimonadota bacterium]
MRISNKIAMLYNGTVIASGTPEEIQSDANPVVKQFIGGLSDGPITD